nr:DUF1800 family protein [Mucilaginibacter sp. X5P1]
MLGYNSTTAKFITGKLAIRFVSHNPPQTLLDKIDSGFDHRLARISTTLIH